ncbi:hypothetical protein KY290_017185 [Solanum tuberosum]|uniref:Integrase core domain containing protein n=1 Tax=Solanum tuberosum TaxID=4113 RepID=A0ABQ7VAL6_SOLTU|nr:hypothetical protein KY284_016218 [Solanum tuberosum]KAH0701946.1 hypothetical protein KY285_016224 [Solanum tuberosum]KAH0761112.1 hypothetical protein KY290_017185 [Solanum tuberosum]
MTCISNESSDANEVERDGSEPSWEGIISPLNAPKIKVENVAIPNKKGKSQDRIHPGPSDLEQLKGQMIFSIKNGILWNMTVSTMFDPASSVRSTQIRKRRECQQTLHAFLEHMPAVFPELVEQRIQQLLNQIQTLEEEGRTLSRDRENLIIRMAFRIWGGNN